MRVVVRGAGATGSAIALCLSLTGLLSAPRPLGRAVLLPFSAAILAVTVALSGLLALRTHGVLSYADRSLTLNVTSRGSDLQVTWNRKAPPVQLATGATLEIEDGNVRRSVPIDSADLRVAKVLYAPASSEVRFRLRVITPDGDRTSQQVSASVHNPR